MFNISMGMGIVRSSWWLIEGCQLLSGIFISFASSIFPFWSITAIESKITGYKKFLQNYLLLKIKYCKMIKLLCMNGPWDNLEKFFFHCSKITKNKKIYFWDIFKKTKHVSVSAWRLIPYFQTAISKLVGHFLRCTFDCELVHSIDKLFPVFLSFSMYYYWMVLHNLAHLKIFCILYSQRIKNIYHERNSSTWLEWKWRYIRGGRKSEFIH